MNLLTGIAWFVGLTVLFYGLISLVQYTIFRKARLKQPISKRTRIICFILGISALCVGYEILSYHQHQKNPNDTTIPSFGQLVEGFRTVTTPEEKENDLRKAFGLEEKKEVWSDRFTKTLLYQDFTATYARLFKGLFWGCVVSIVIGILMGCYEWLEALLLPPLSLLSYIPGTAMYAVFFAIVSTGEPLFVAMISFGIMPILTKSIYLSAKHDVHDEEINKAYTLGASNFEVAWNVVTPQIMPKLLDSVRLQIGPAMVFLIAAEMLTAQVGFGYQMRLRSRMLDMNIVYDYLLILGEEVMKEVTIKVPEALAKEFLKLAEKCSDDMGNAGCNDYEMPNTQDSRDLIDMAGADNCGKRPWMNNIVLDIKNVSQWFGDNRVLHELNLQVVRGQFMALVGGSGCGKSTLLRAILGTVPQKAGEILIDGNPVKGPNRNVGVVYQRYGLYQFLTAEQNVAFGPMLDETSLLQRCFMPWSWWPQRKKHLEEAREFLTKFKLGHAHKHYPNELSGGMQQRVAIAQALIMRPKILLLDEPFGALDEATREELQQMLLILYQENVEAVKANKEPPWTVVIITHELDEAFYVSDRVIGLSKSWNRNGLRGEHNGATIVWDQHSPVYHPDEPRDFQKFAEMKHKLREVVLNDKEVDPNENATFWNDIERGVGSGVALTNGLVSALLTTLPGISQWHCGSFATYRPPSKRKWLGVSETIIRKYTCESEYMAREMAYRALKQTPEADYSAAVVGHLGPTEPDKDGRYWIGMADRTTMDEQEPHLTHSFTGRCEESGRVARQFEIAFKVVDLIPICEQELKAGKSVVLDNTFPTIPSRQPFIDLAKKLGCEIHCVHLTTPFEDAQLNACLRMMDRAGKILGPNDKTKDPNLFPPAALFRYKKLYENKKDKGTYPVPEHPGKQDPKKEHGFDTVVKRPFERVWGSEYTNAALILDADDTIRRSVGEKAWPEKPEDVQVIDGCKERIEEYMAEEGITLLFGASNQSAIAKGRMTHDEVKACFAETNHQIGLDIPWLYSPWLPPTNITYCRKPHCGMGAQLIYEHKLLPSKCLYVGDSTSDKTFAKRCGFQYQHPKEFFGWDNASCGTIIKCDTHAVWVISTGHMMVRNEPVVEVFYLDGKKLKKPIKAKGKIVLRVENNLGHGIDFSLIKVGFNKDIDHAKFKSIPLGAAAKDQKCVSVGCDLAIPPTEFSAKVVEIRSDRGDIFTLSEKPTYGGRSGGGLFHDGKLVAISWGATLGNREKGVTSVLLMAITFKFSIAYVPYFWALVIAFFVVIVFRVQVMEEERVWLPAMSGHGSAYRFDMNDKDSFKESEMEIGKCAMLFIVLFGGLGGIALLFLGGRTINHWWNKPPSPPTDKPNGPLSKAMRYMADEAHRLGITIHRVAVVASCLVLFTLVGWGSTAAYNNVTVTDCGKGDVAIKIHNRGQSRSVVLTGNIYDLYHDGNKWVPLMDYLTKRYNVKAESQNRGIVVVKYELNDDIELIGAQRQEVFDNWDRILKGKEKSLSDCIKNSHKNGTYALELMRMMTLVSRKSPHRNYDLILIIEGTDMLVPDEEISRMSLYDRKRVAILQDWLSDPDFVDGKDTVVMVAESRSQIHHRISRLPQVVTVQIASPDLETRKKYIEDNDTPGDTQRLAQQTAGLSLHAIRQILRGESITDEAITEKVEEYISSQLGDGVIEFKKPSHKLDEVVGFSRLKAFARKELIPRFQATGDAALPGCAVGGAIGGGKTFFFEAVAAELGMPVLVMKSMRSQWFGQTDVIFERFQRAITALDKVAIFVDEADTAFGKIQGGHETERRLTGKIQAMMSDPRLRGKVIWMLMTARIHLLSPDIRRPGRVGDLIIPILDPEGDDRIEFIKWTFSSLEDGDEAELFDGGFLEQATLGYSAASFAGLRSQIKASGCKTVTEALDVARDMLPPDIEETRRYQTLQALLNCTRMSLLPDVDENPGSLGLEQRTKVEEQRKEWRREVRELEMKGVQ
ncbi:unnamed protein product [Symbiodinium microadriaticum]|nr:unnamed protein product [Symbiodinium microadriaticum]